MAKQRRIEGLASERGQAMTELAIVLPIFLTILFAVVQFGSVWRDYITLTDAARAGARKAAVSRHGDPKQAGCDQVKATAGDLRKPVTCSVVVSGPAERPDVTVKASYPYNVTILGITIASGDLKTETTELME